MKMKIEIKNRITGKVLFEFETADNTIRSTLIEAVRQGADLSGADLRGEKIKQAIVFSGLYTYIVIPYITEKNEKRLKMGCCDRLLSEWESDFWNNENEFPNDNSLKSNLRLMAFETAKKWFELIEKDELNKSK